MGLGPRVFHTPGLSDHPAHIHSLVLHTLVSVHLLRSLCYAESPEPWDLRRHCFFFWLFHPSFSDLGKNHLPSQGLVATVDNTCHLQKAFKFTPNVLTHSLCEALEMGCVTCLI